MSVSETRSGRDGFRESAAAVVGCYLPILPGFQSRTHEPSMHTPMPPAAAKGSGPAHLVLGAGLIDGGTTVTGIGSAVADADEAVVDADVVVVAGVSTWPGAGASTAAGVPDCVGADGADAPPTDPIFMPGGYQPPFAQVPPPSATNGSGVVQPPDTGAGLGVEVGAGTGAGDGDTIVGGNQPPLMQTPPPIATNGSGVRQELDVGVGVGAGCTGAGATDGEGSSGNCQPPFTHRPPPNETNGSGVRQGVEVWAGVGLVTGAGDGVGVGTGDGLGVGAGADAEF